MLRLLTALKTKFFVASVGIVKPAAATQNRRAPCVLRRVAM